MNEKDFTNKQVSAMVSELNRIHNMKAIISNYFEMNHYDMEACTVESDSIDEQHDIMAGNLPTKNGNQPFLAMFNRSGNLERLDLYEDLKYAKENFDKYKNGGILEGYIYSRNMDKDKLVNYNTQYAKRIPEKYFEAIKASEAGDNTLRQAIARLSAISNEREQPSLDDVIAAAEAEADKEASGHSKEQTKDQEAELD